MEKEIKNETKAKVFAADKDSRAIKNSFFISGSDLVQINKHIKLNKKIEPATYKDVYEFNSQLY